MEIQEKTNKSYTESLTRLCADERIIALRQNALVRHIPVMDDHSLQFLLTLLTALQPKKILEIGTAVGLSGAAMLKACPHARLVTIECDEERYVEARKNLASLGVADRAICHLGDAGEVLRLMDAHYDFVLLDGPKAQYPAYLTELKRMLSSGGTIFTDDVLLFGWVSGQTPTPEKHTLFVKRMQEWLSDLSHDETFTTTILDVGNGVALSVKR
jgi:predicted O-methyltransferase YrrM